MDIVDSQIHLGPGGIDVTLAAMDAVGVSSAVIDEAWLGAAFMPYYVVAQGRVRRPTTPTAELAALTHPDRFSYLVRVDRRDPEVKSIVRLLADRPGARALRIAPGLSLPELRALQDGGYDELFAAALDAGLRVVFVAIPGNAPALSGVMKRFPEMKFVIDHCGMPTPGAYREAFRQLTMGEEPPQLADTSDDKARTAEFEKVLRLADAHSNAGMKWAHAQRMFGVGDYPFEELRPYIRQALDTFGSARLMWASDASANKTGESWAQLLFWLIHNPDMSVEERTDLLGGTARSWLGWPAG